MTEISWILKNVFVKKKMLLQITTIKINYIKPKYRNVHLG